MNKLIEKWNKLTPKGRLALIHTDPSMRHPHWKTLADSWSKLSWNEMTLIQQDATLELLKGAQ